MKKIVITGGAGFLGHHVVEYFLKNTNWKICVLDKLTYAARGLDRIRDIEVYDKDRISFFSYDITKPISEGIYRETGSASYIIHLAAESHVDNSITDPTPFIMSNVVGTMNMLNFARKCDNLKAFNYFSTDEVFGPASEGQFYKEWDRYNSTNPYSASKAAGEELSLAWANTYQIPLFITHTMNIFGERQHPEKYIPLCIRKILKHGLIKIHSNEEKTKSGSRFYIHARNVADGIAFLLDNFEQREKYNIVGEQEVTNLDLAKKISKIIGKPLNYEMVDFHSSRPGHDLRYALDGTRMANLGWTPPMSFEKSLEKTINWTLKRKEWIEL
ncbi:MAG: dTDP-glucose 4,6-dehydratase [Promethearchaeota archaeon]